MPISKVTRPSAAAERAAWLDALLNHSPIGIAVPVDRVMTEVNDHCCKLLGYRRAELIGQSVRMLHCTDE
jgi:PAS domain S-box-containing protein